MLKRTWAQVTAIVIVTVLIAPMAWAATLDGGDLVGVDFGNVVHIDADQGWTQSIIASSAIGTGPGLSFLVDVVLEASGALLVSGGSSVTIYRVDPATGDRSVVSSGSIGTGPSLGAWGPFAGAMLLEADGHILISTAAGILRVDPTTGDRALVSASTNALAMTAEASGDVVLVRDANTIERLDPSTGAAVVLSSISVGSGEVINEAVDLDLEADGSIIVVDRFADFLGSQESLVRVDPVTGHRVVVSGCPGTSPICATTTNCSSPIAWPSPKR